MIQKLAILDAGSQFAKIIDRKVRELNVASEILPLDTSASELEQYKAIIISCGPESVYGAQAPTYDADLFFLNKPILGICYGMQLMAYSHQGLVEKKELREDGQFEINLDLSCDLFQGMETQEKVLLTHGDSVENPGNGFRVVAKSGEIIAAIENTQKKFYGIQFHPEVDLTVHGKELLRNFLYEIAGFDGSYTIEDREEKALREIREKVGDKQVLVLVSGGVDSTVCAALVTKALSPEKIIAVHIDNGLMRLHESKKVAHSLTQFGLKLHVIDAAETFYNATTQIGDRTTLPLKKVEIAEEKRQIIGNTFIRVVEKELRKLGFDPNQVYLVQGSLRPDLIESASSHVSKNAKKIKTHHNDTRLVRKLRDQGLVIEPLSEYHKDEVRQLGERLGLPTEITWRQPFPGPGLGVRILCANKPHLTADFDKINQKLKTEFSDENIAATLLPIRTVGIQGDGRTYSYAVGLSGERDWQKLFVKAKKIPQTIHQVNRVVYIFGDKVTAPVNSITPTHLLPDAIKQLQAADEIVNQILLKYDLLRSLSQVPVILFPIDFGVKGQRSIAIRTFMTNDFMTGVPAVPEVNIPEQAILEMVARILNEVAGISRVVYDLTAKPPGTTEWE